MSVSATSVAPRGPANQLLLSPSLSLQQEFLCVFDKSAGPTLVYAWRLDGEVDMQMLQLTLDDVVELHDTVRMSIIRADGVRSVLVLTTHSNATDASSMHVVMRDLAACYRARTGLRLPSPVLDRARGAAPR
jgi:hypothetical protein